MSRKHFAAIAPAAPGYKVLPNLLCSRGELQSGETLDGFVNRQLKELMGQVKNFDLISRQDVEFGGRPAVELVFAMKPQSVMLQQRQLFFQVDRDKPLVNTVVATAARDNFEELAPVFESILRSVTWNN